MIWIFSSSFSLPGNLLFLNNYLCYLFPCRWFLILYSWRVGFFHLFGNILLISLRFLRRTFLQISLLVFYMLIPYSLVDFSRLFFRCSFPLNFTSTAPFFCVTSLQTLCVIFKNIAGKIY